jgi:fructose-1,6-bisphosphatase/inositol monophosphatase family enzyme
VSAPDAAGLRDLAVSVAREAGEMLAARTGRVEVAATKSSPTDVVTEMDRRSEELIRSRILAARPSDAVLGEEGGQTGDADDAPVRWVIDPLDGTVNYLYGLHDWAVSVAAEVRWAEGGEVGGAEGGEVGGAEGGEVGGAEGGEVGRKIVAGAVFVPVRGEMFSAFAGGGAWLEAAGADGSKARLHCLPGVPLDQALVGTGFGYLAARRKVQGEVVAALLPRIRDIRRIGVASVDLCAVAAGHLDGFYERGLNYWDWAAGALVATEAGAVVGGLNGAPVSSSMAVAAGPGLFGPLADALAALDPERDA